MTPPRPEPRKIVKGRIFNHRDGMAELEKFQMENKPRTAEKLSEFIFDGLSRDITRKELTSKIQQAIGEARAEALKSGGDECKQHWKKAYAQGFSDCRERAAKIIETHDPWFSGKIRALKPSEK